MGISTSQMELTFDISTIENGIAAECYVFEAEINSKLLELFQIYG